MRKRPKKKKKKSPIRTSFNQVPQPKSVRPARMPKPSDEIRPSESDKENKKETSGDPAYDQDTTRLNKFMAHCGVASRRACAELIKDGKVTINGKVVLEPGYRVKPEDVVKYDGKKLRTESKMIYILMNKPKNTITTVSDEKGRKTVMDVIGDKVKQRIFPVGRLDRATTGLLILTNDGDLTKKLSHPSHEVKKVYYVSLDKPVSEEHIELIRTGITLEDGLAPVDGVSHIQGKGKTEVGIEIHIGRNRIVRRIFEHFGYQVLKLDRVYYAGLTKKDLPRGWFRNLSKKEVIMLKHFV